VLPSDEEPDADRALQLRAAIMEETVRALVPGLWLYDVANTIARRFPTVASGWLCALKKFGLEEVTPSNAWLLKTLDLTSRHDVSFYDAAYHSLALIHGGVFVTADTRYANKVKESGSVVELSEWEPPRSAALRPGGKPGKESLIPLRGEVLRTGLSILRLGDPTS
jgi:predicted nucleic acid-binding protein